MARRVAAPPPPPATAAPGAGQQASMFPKTATNPWTIALAALGGLIASFIAAVVLIAINDGAGSRGGAAGTWSGLAVLAFVGIVAAIIGAAVHKHRKQTQRRQQAAQTAPRPASRGGNWRFVWGSAAAGLVVLAMLALWSAERTGAAPERKLMRVGGGMLFVAACVVGIAIAAPFIRRLEGETEQPRKDVDPATAPSFARPHANRWLGALGKLFFIAGVSAGVICAVPIPALPEPIVNMAFELGDGGASILALIGAVLLIAARHPQGLLHMVRGAASIFMVLGAIAFLLFEGRESLEILIHGPYSAFNEGRYFKPIAVAGALLLGGGLLSLWPARRPNPLAPHARAVVDAELR